MSKKFSSFIFLILIFFNNILFITSSYPLFPTILTVSLPLNNDDQKDYSESRVENSFFRWLQASGADLIVVHPWTSIDEINLLLSSKVNGVLFQGNSNKIDPSSSYYLLIKKIFNKVIEINEKGTKLPLLVIGDDCTLISSILNSDDSSIVTNLNEKNKILHPSNLNFYLNLDKTIILKEFMQKDSNIFETKNILPNYLNKFISINEFIKNFHLSKFFKIIATSKANDGQEYVALAEGKKFPVILMTFHPEFVGFQKQGGEIIVPESLESIFAARFIGNSFVFFGRKNNGNQLTVEEKKKYDFIEPYEKFPELVNERFNYVFKNNKK